MQMIKENRKGITLISLIISIIVLSIILGITINYGLTELHDVENKKMESELSIVQEAIMQRYALVKASNQLGISANSITENKALSDDANRPKGLIGTRIAKTQSIIDYGFSGVTLMSNYTPESTYEEYYYLLDEEDLLELGIKKGDDTEISEDTTPKERSYIVNYLTGEIFDIANKKYYKTDMTNDDPVYKQPTKITTSDNKVYDFNDD